MNNLSEKKCVPCEGSTPPFTMEQIRNYQNQLTSVWEVIDQKKIHKQFTFDSFDSAMVFVNDVAVIAQEEDHHPDITINYKKVTIELTTHAINGLSENDFIVAAKIEKLI